jgi:hypothetical protein
MKLKLEEVIVVTSQSVRAGALFYRRIGGEVLNIR